MGYTVGRNRAGSEPTADESKSVSEFGDFTEALDHLEIALLEWAQADDEFAQSVGDGPSTGKRAVSLWSDEITGASFATMDSWRKHGLSIAIHDGDGKEFEFWIRRAA